MGIGDVTLPLAPAVIDAMQKAVAENGREGNFPWLRTGAGL